MTYAVSLNGIEAGQGEPYILTAVSGLGQTARRVGRTPQPGGGTLASGVDVGESRDIVCEITISDNDPAAAELYIDQLVAAWAPTGTDVDLVVTLARGPRVYRGRPVGVDVDDSELYAGTIRARCTFDLLNPLWFSGIEQSVTVATAVTTGGFITPMVTPLVTTASGSTGDAGVTNHGTASAPWAAFLVGPLTSPSLILNGIRIVVDGVIPSGETAVVDSLTHSVTMASQVRHWVSYVSAWWDIPPGASTFSLRATAGTGTATLVWRDANY